MTWLPVATAPKTGQRVLLWDDYNSLAVAGRWEPETSSWYLDDGDYATDDITHWMPLPDKP